MKTALIPSIRIPKPKIPLTRRASSRVATPKEKIHLMDKSLERKIISFLNCPISKLSNLTPSFFKVFFI